MTEVKPTAFFVYGVMLQPTEPPRWGPIRTLNYTTGCISEPKATPRPSWQPPPSLRAQLLPLRAPLHPAGPLTLAPVLRLPSQGLCS